jgi:hypothetical protein
MVDKETRPWNYMAEQDHVIPELHDCQIMSFRKWQSNGSGCIFHMRFRIYMPCGFGTTYVIPEPHVSGISCGRSRLCTYVRGLGKIYYSIQSGYIVGTYIISD